MYKLTGMLTRYILVVKELVVNMLSKKLLGHALWKSRSQGLGWLLAFASSLAMEPSFMVIVETAIAITFLNFILFIIIQKLSSSFIIFFK